MAKRILAVDDEEHIRLLVQRNLERVGYEVITASNGREALEAAHGPHPDLIVMDVMMPEMDGFAALEVLKGDEATKSIPVILLTAQAQDAEVLQGWQGGAHAYLTKPVDIKELLVFVERILATSDETGGSDNTYELRENASDTA